MKTINSTTILKVARRKVISNDIIFFHNDIKYSVVYDGKYLDMHFYLQALNENGEWKKIAKIIIN